MTKVSFVTDFGCDFAANHGGVFWNVELKFWRQMNLR
jgi:hypothetical protein